MGQMLTAAMVADESGENVANRRETRKYGSVAFDLRIENGMECT